MHKKATLNGSMGLEPGTTAFVGSAMLCRLSYEALFILFNALMLYCYKMLVPKIQLYTVSVVSMHLSACVCCFVVHVMGHARAEVPNLFVPMYPMDISTDYQGPLKSNN